MSSMRKVEWPEFYAIAKDAGVTLPLEQTIAWDSFDNAVPGRMPWGRLVYMGASGEPRALISLTRMCVRKFPYLWAKHGPVWLGSEPSAAEEADFRAKLIEGIRFHDTSIVFARIHALHKASDCFELLQTKTYDRTIVMDLDKADDDAVLASFKSRGRRDVRKALRNEALTCADETERAEDVFDELYDILVETGERDGFRAAPKETYLRMLRSLGPEHCRLYVARNNGGEALVWSIVTVWEDLAFRYYAGSSHEGRRMRAADALLYREACWLRESGVKTYDLMGIDSDRAPELAGVREFKAKFIDGEPTDVAGAWDVAVRPTVYKMLVRLLHTKRDVAGLVATVRARAMKANAAPDAE